MTHSISEAIASTLYRARVYLCAAYGGCVPLDAVEILFDCECAIRLEDSQN